MRAALLANWRQGGGWSCVTALGEVDVLEVERFLVELGFRSHAGELPPRDVGEVLVVAERLTVFGLVLDAEVAAAALLAAATRRNRGARRIP